ncbi:hypothetical protein A1D29_03420 [Pasteurellaceae bacterium Orientalotternb1]|nr:hypothetical protein A1D29_03420 [Pasteurellaceae bacterium Orientalotternb1]
MKKIDFYMQVQFVFHILLPLTIIFIFNKKPTYEFELLLDKFMDECLFGYIGTYSSNVLFQSKIIVNYMAITFFIHFIVLLFIAKRDDEFTLRESIKYSSIYFIISIWVIYLIYFHGSDFYKEYKDAVFSTARGGNIFSYSFRVGATLGIGIYTSYLLIQSVKAFIFRFFHKDS